MWGYQPHLQAETNHKRAWKEVMLSSSEEVMLSGLQIHIHPSNLHPVSHLTLPSLGLLSRQIPLIPKYFFVFVQVKIYFAWLYSNP